MVLSQLPSIGSAATAKVAANPKLAAAAKQFETVLLSQWLQGAESSFGSVPGGDSDTDAGGEQMQGFATQQLATSFTEQGGVGISKLVLGALTKADGQEHGHTTPEASAVNATSTAQALMAYRAGGSR